MPPSGRERRGVGSHRSMQRVLGMWRRVEPQ